MARKRRPFYVTDVLALRGPDGTLDGDARALLLAVPRDDGFDDRRARLRARLRGVEDDYDPETRRALTRTLYPFVRRRFAHRIDEDARASARADARAQDQALAALDAVDARYGGIERARELLEALRAIVAHPPWTHASPRRRPARGNPSAALAREAREALGGLRAEERDEDGRAVSKRGRPSTVRVLDDDAVADLLRLVALL